MAHVYMSIYCTMSPESGTYDCDSKRGGIFSAGIWTTVKTKRDSNPFPQYPTLEKVAVGVALEGSRKLDCIPVFSLVKDSSQEYKNTSKVTRFQVVYSC